MPGDPIDARERAALCDLFLELGPDKPTLCEGWDTLDLAAHLHIRENDLLRTPAIVFGGERFAPMAARVTDAAKARGLDTLVAELRAGPPRIPWQLPGLRPVLNLGEWFIHHEDVRRANGGAPRPADAERDDALWTQLRRAARPLLLLKARGQNVELVAPGFGAIPGRGDNRSVRVTGTPGELMLYVYGRKDAAEVDLAGDPEAVETFRTTDLSL